MNIEYVNAYEADVSIEEWTEAKSYRFHVALIKEDDGTFSIIALNLPGTGSIGDTEEEALANFREAATGVLESYADSSEPIPWKSTDNGDIPDDAKWHKWIIVRVN